jgi:4'-phosphopantetheinyl transferase
VKRNGPAPRPVILRGPQGPWSEVEHRLEEQGTVLAHGTVTRWAPAASGGPVPADGAPLDAGQSALRALLGEEWGRYLAMRQESARVRFAASRSLLKHVSGCALGVAPAELELARLPGGRPYLRGCDHVDISLSHTGDLVLVGLTRRGGIGVDVEPAGREIGTPEDDRRMWTPAEARALAPLPPARKRREMLRLWTLKESYSKAIGQGMRMPFGAFGFTCCTRHPRMTTPDGLLVPDRGWAFGTRVVGGRYVIGWAVHETGAAGPDVGSGASLLDAALVEAVTAAGTG